MTDFYIKDMYPGFADGDTVYFDCDVVFNDAVTFENTTFGGTTAIGDASTDTLSLVALTTVATNQKIQFRDTGLFINSSADGQLDIDADTELELTAPTIQIAASTKFDVNGMLDVSDELAGGASNGNVIKKTLQSGEAYTGTTAGLMVKNYCADDTVTVPSGEFCAVYASLKGLHVDPGNNTSIISAHVHASNTTTVHAGLWLYGDMTNGVKASGSTLTNMIDISEATAVTNLFALPAAETAPCGSNTSGSTTLDFANWIPVSVLVNGVQHYAVVAQTIAATGA